MSKVAGYLVILNKDRFVSFYSRSYEQFAEPVPEFSHSRNVPLICFIINEEGNINQIGHGKRGVRAGTDLRRLNIQDIFELDNPISAIEIVSATPSGIKHHLTRKLVSGGLIPPKSFEEFLKVFLERAHETIPILYKYSKERRIKIEQLSNQTKQSLAEQKEAVLTAMNIAGINKENAQGWDYIEGEKPISFLDGIKDVNILIVCFSKRQNSTYSCTGK
jgi:hypothetical protein